MEIIKEKDIKHLNKKALELGASKAFKINLKKELIFEERVKLLCTTCPNYNNKPCCPPHIPNLNYEKIMKEYKGGLLIFVNNEFKDIKDFDNKRITSTNDLHKILLNLEKESFNLGYSLSTSFMGGSCKLCKKCEMICKQPTLSRIPIEATGVNVIKTLSKFNKKISFPVEKYKEFKRVGLLLIGGKNENN